MRLFCGITLVMALAVHPSSAQVQYQVAFPNLVFDEPVDIQNAGDGSNRLFLVERHGRIWVFDNNPNVASATLFLDITSQVDSNGPEEGLLGLTFHPDYADSGYFYINYTAAGPIRSVISRFHVTVPDSADVGSEHVVILLDRPATTHNAGQLAFGPDGYLYIATGDGGGTGDPFGNAQNLTTLLGSMLRIDVDSTQGSLNYAIPPDNPYVGNMQGYREEIFAHGFRNLWRFSFDPATGWLWAGDVGQDLVEEVDIVESGKNYGWPIMEGPLCYPSDPCDTTGLTLPIWDYQIPQASRAISGGHVYHGANAPSLEGKYICGDAIVGTIWAVDYNGTGAATDTILFPTTFPLSSFGVDESGELYFCDLVGGQIYSFWEVPTGIREVTPAFTALGQNFPNPFNPTTWIPYSVSRAGHVRLAVYDVTGRLVSVLVDASHLEGPYVARWDAEEIPSGVYFYRLEAGEIRESRTMTLLK